MPPAQLETIFKQSRSVVLAMAEDVTGRKSVLHVSCFCTFKCMYVLIRPGPRWPPPPPLLGNIEESRPETRAP